MTTATSSPASAREEISGWRRTTREDFVTGLPADSAVHIRFDPWNGTQPLTYTTYTGGGKVCRVSYTG